MGGVVKRELRECPKHGLVEYIAYQYQNKVQWRCSKCQSEAVQKRRDHTKLLALAYKGNKCQCCGYNKYAGALEFHPINPNEKDFGISTKGYTRSWERNKQELDKCVLVCSNCHREIHGGIIPCPTEIIKDDEAVLKLNQSFRKSTKSVEKDIIKVNKITRPDKETLINDFKEYKTFTALGRLYGVSDNAVRKWFSKFNLPTHSKELKTLLDC